MRNDPHIDSIAIITKRFSIVFGFMAALLAGVLAGKHFEAKGIMFVPIATRPITRRFPVRQADATKTRTALKDMITTTRQHGTENCTNNGETNVHGD